MSCNKERKTAAHWRDVKKNDLRSLIRHLALDVLSISSNIIYTKRLSNIPRVHFLYFHHIYADEIEGFRYLLGWLKNEGVKFVSYSDAVESLSKPNENEVCISLSFDDGLKSCIDASHVMDEFDAKGCFFVNGKVIDNKKLDLVDRFSKERLNMGPQDYMGWKDLESLVMRGHEIGNHTYSHIDGGTATLSEFYEDFNKNHGILTKQIIKPVHFAWPYGGKKNIKEDILTMVKEAGYKSAASAIRGCHLANHLADPYFILREHCVALWPVRHIKYFMLQSVRNAEAKLG